MKSQAVFEVFQKAVQAVFPDAKLELKSYTSREKTFYRIEIKRVDGKRIHHDVTVRYRATTQKFHIESIRWNAYDILERHDNFPEGIASAVAHTLEFLKA